MPPGMGETNAGEETVRNGQKRSEAVHRASTDRTDDDDDDDAARPHLRGTRQGIIRARHAAPDADEFSENFFAGDKR